MAAYPSISRWSGRYALVTGASYGLGAAFCRALTEHGVHVIGVGRSIDKIKALASEVVTAGHPGLLHPYQADLTKEAEIVAMFEWIRSKFNGAGVDILVNNAGVCAGESIIGSTDEKSRAMFELNVLAVLSCDRQAIASMRARGVDDGHIFHINSILGHVIKEWPQVHTYGATKWSITHINEGLRQELAATGSRIRVTSISPAAVDTQLHVAAFGEEVYKQIIVNQPSLQAKDVADMLIFALSCPPHITIHEMTVRAAGAPL